MSLSPKSWIRRLVRGRIAASAIAAAGTLHLQGAKVTPLQPATGTAKAGFGLLSPADTALTFTNQLSDREAAINQIRLNGSGVALGDVNADGLTDIYLCGLENSNALYLNQGSWKFKKAADHDAAACGGQFSTGCALADVDGDQDLDLLVAGIGAGVRLFLNDGTGRFSEQRDSGLPQASGAMTLALADIDSDGDLDLYIANYQTQTIRSTGYLLLNSNGRRSVRPQDRDRIELTSDGRVLELGEPDALCLNDGNGRFTTVSLIEGRFRDSEGRPLRQPLREWGLTALFRDLDQDGDPDLYVCNDFQSPDRIWMNQGDGAFRELGREAIGHTSTFSMSIAVGDINRDGLDDWFVADMLARSEPRRLMKLASTAPYEPVTPHSSTRPQYDRNSLYLNLGDGRWIDIAPMAGVDATDWTWSAGFLDVDLDGNEDLLCTTGHGFDIQDLDAEARIVAKGPWSRDQVPFKVLMYPPLRQRLLAFRNTGQLSFEHSGDSWGFQEEGIAHGMAFGDLDNDGDLDVVVTRLNQATLLFRNEASAGRIAVRLQGSGENTGAIGSRIEARGYGGVQSRELIAGGRYLSDDAPEPCFATGAGGRLDLRVRWPSGKVSEARGVPSGSLVEFQESSATQPETPPAQPTVKPLFENLTARLRHRHSASNDAASSVQGSLPRDLGSLSPGTAWSATGGTNGAELWLIHGGQTGPSRVGIGPGDSYKYAGLDPGHHVGGEVLAILSVKLGTTNIATFGTKGSLDPKVPSQLLPLNATAAEVLKPLSLPSYPGPIAMADIDGDGDLDLFVGGRCVPGRWPAPASSTILRLEGGRYAADTEADPVLKNIGLVSGAVFSDLDDDGDPDLALACEWGPVRVLINEKGRLVDATKAWGLGNEIGLWNGIIAGDFNNDGRMDLMASNEGLNNGVAIRNGRAGRIMMAYGDLRGDGTFGFLEGVEDAARGTWVALRPFNQVALTWPSLRDRFPSYSAYNHASFDEILGDARQRATLIRADTFASTIFLNRSNKFEATMLPMEAQRAPCFGIGLGDFDGDGNEDVFLAQNLSAVDSITPPANSGDGVLLRGRGDGSFQALPPKESGIRQRGDGRGVAAADFNRDGRLDLVVAQHNHSTLLFRNDTGKPGIHVQLNGSSVNPDAIGASVRLIYANRKGPRREVRAGGGYLSQDEPRIVMGAAEPVVGVEVRWPQGKAIRIPVQPNSQSAEATYGKPLGTGE